MEPVFVVLVFLLMVALSGVLVRFLPLPLPLVQVALGAVLAAVPHGIVMTLEPELFLLLFIPPLLFSDGWRIPKRAFFRERKTILLLAFGLVFFTVVGAGYFINWLIPTIPLAAAFALAAVLSPTDAVAVSAISGRARIPRRLMSVLQGESLLNDASGLVAFKFAVGAALTGAFSLKAAAVSFVAVAVGGIAVGAALAFAIDWGRHRLARWRGESSGTQIILTLLLPFTAYLVAEHLGWSGILAAVAAGIAMNYTSFSRDGSLETRIQSATIWGMLEMSFNGVIFILLGLQLPGILRQAPKDAVEAGGHSVWVLLWYVLVITLALGVLRFAWVWCSLRLTVLRAALSRRKVRPAMGWKLILATSLAGVRGAVTLAGVLSVPLLMPDGSPFPARNLLVFLAAGVILVSLLAGSFGLPFLMRNLEVPEDRESSSEEKQARRLITEAAVGEIESRSRELAEKATDAERVLIEQAGARLVLAYRQRLGAFTEAGGNAHLAYEAERRLRLEAMRRERAELFRLHDAREIGNETLDLLLHEVDLREAAAAGAHIGHL